MPHAAPYSERVTPSATWWALAPGIGLMGAVVAYPFGPTAALASGLVLALGVGYGLWRLSPVVAVSDELRVNRAHIPVQFIGSVDVLDRAGVRVAMGPELDARAHVMFRTWAPGAVRVSVTDPADRTPYWLVSARRPDRVAAALVERGAQAAHSEQTG